MNFLPKPVLTRIIQPYFYLRSVCKLWCTIIDSRHRFHEEDLAAICRGGSLRILDLYQRQFQIRYWEPCAENACIGGRKDILQYLGGKSVNNWNNLLKIACFKGDVELAEIVVKNGGTFYGWGLISACKGGQMETALLMLKYGANDFDAGFCEACDYGHLELARLMVDKGAICWNMCVGSACIRNDVSTLKFLVGCGATYWGKSVYRAAKRGCVDVIDYILSINPNKDLLNQGLSGACKGDHKNLIPKFLKAGATECSNCKNDHNK